MLVAGLVRTDMLVAGEEDVFVAGLADMLVADRFRVDTFAVMAAWDGTNHSN